ncbi:hypothetical protein BH09MYX1_BH09MYX1_14400 [soil metagenome]
MLSVLSTLSPVVRDLDALDRAVAELAAAVRLLHAVTPTNAREEHQRLGDVFLRGGSSMPRWTYANAPVPAVAATLPTVAQAAARHGSTLGIVYFARITEIARELAVQARAGTREIGAHASERYRMAHGDGLIADADETARRWVAARPDPDDAPRRATDDPHPASLKSLLEREIGARKLAFGVRVVYGLASLAATGAQNVYVARGRLVTDAVARRTAVHEIEGHVTPRARARSAPLRLFFVGTAGGHDTQEGFALWHEERSELLDGERRAELGLRHLACREMDRGADFVEVMRRLVRDLGASQTTALAITERIFRGSDGRSAGLGRERVYLPQFLRVRSHLGTRPEDAAILGAGQLGLDVLDLARELLERDVA